ncbi:hypothetical protein B0H19DRAFT_1067664 [Mycena capillaripes]|nr:hypothetical protein B0H19DRAFT_1067664 [Mycena capillaripes]
MAHSSPPGKASSLFTTHRRAYMACLNCRKRKVRRLQLTKFFPIAQCVQLSEGDFTQCIRCTRKGIQCEYVAVSEDVTSSQPSTPPPHIRVPGREYTHNPPSAGLSAYLNPHPPASTGVRRHTISSTPYPYPARRASASPMPVSNARSDRPARSRSSAGYSPEELDWSYPVKPLVAKQGQSFRLETLQYRVDTQLPAAGQASWAGVSSGGENHGEVDMSPSGMVSAWPEAMGRVSAAPTSTPNAPFDFLVIFHL